MSSSPGETQVSVAVARFEEILGRGLRALIEDDESLELVADGIAPERLAKTLCDLQPQVAILNFGSLTTSGELRDLRRACPDTQLFVLANGSNPGECRQILAFGATACLPKSSDARDVLHAIHLASRGLHVLPATGGDLSPPAGPELLTPREADVLELLQDGQSNAEIAQALHVGVETIRTHARRIYRKLGVKTRRELLARR